MAGNSTIITIIEGTTLSTPEESTTAFNIYPNPTKGKVTIQGLTQSENVSVVVVIQIKLCWTYL